MHRRANLVEWGQPTASFLSIPPLMADESGLLSLVIIPHQVPAAVYQLIWKRGRMKPALGGVPVRCRAETPGLREPILSAGLARGVAGRVPLESTVPRLPKNGR